MSTRKRVYTKQMPPTPVTPEMRQKMYSIAESEGVSLASIQRQAFSLFLSENDSNPLHVESKANKAVR